MLDTEKLKALVSDLMQVSVDTVSASTVFSGILATSLGRARLDAALRSRFGISNNGVYTVKTFGDLCRLLGGEAAGENTVSAAPRSQSISLLSTADNTGIAIGIDIQSVDALPNATDYWEEEFYQQHFTRQEIAYALLQPNPRESFASAWCAKEALRKADARWLDIDWHQTELTHTSTGIPALNSGDQSISCSVSVSHTAGLAVAVVAMGGADASGLSKPAASLLEPAVIQPTGSVQHNLSPLILAVVAVLISLIAAGVAFYR